MKRPSGIRFRLLLLSAACTMPAFFLLSYDAWKTNQSEVESAKADLRARARASATDLGRDVRSARALLRSLAQLGELVRADPAKCSQRLKQLASPYTEIGNVFAMGMDGVIRCSSAAEISRTKVSDRDYFIKALASTGIVAGIPIRSRTNSDRYVLPLALAIRDPSGNAGGVVAVGINVGRFAQDALAASSMETVLTWWDVDGSILFRWPQPEEWIGKSNVTSLLGKAVMNSGAGSVEELGPDGIYRVHGMAEIGSTGQTLTLSVTRDALLASHREALLRNFGALILISLAGFVIAWFFGEVLIRRPLIALSRFAQRMVDGELHIRSNLQEFYGEVGTVAQSFDRMADALTAQIAALQASEQRLREGLDRAEVAERRLRNQLEYMNLLDQVTRAIEEKLDLQSIFQVVVRTVEERLPADFCCLAMYDAAENGLKIECISRRGHLLDRELAESGRIAIDSNGLSRCIGGELVYEPDIANIDVPFPARLARAGLRALLLAPLRAESRVFGVLVAARLEAQSFSSTECEFLRQLSEHVALAAHQAQLHGALQQAYDDLRQTQQVVMQEERLRALGQMASGVAHDINNALSPVSLYTTTLLESESGLSERARHYLETIQRAVDDVAETVARMREFYRMHEDRLENNAVNLNEVAMQVLNLTRARWSDMAQRQGISIDARTALDASIPKCLGVESEIREALTNLVFNAVDAMPGGGGFTIRTCSRTARDGQVNVIVEVQDEGVGMTPAVRQRCLEPFFTTKGERGTGLGLAMVFGAMQRHNGNVEIDSEPGRGTTVSLVFPAIDRSGSGGRDEAQAAPARPRRLRLLLVDDDPILLNSLRESLETDGHVITVAHGGAEGIALFKEAVAAAKQFDVVITDLGMPQVDGRKVAAAIKEAKPGTPVILLTGWGQRLVADGDVPPFVDRLVSKPPKLAAVRSALLEVTRTSVAGLDIS
jgi:signal transduction histidine kinase/ActR/RegA family two-component response regulator/HAMP domain-containing protein